MAATGGDGRQTVAAGTLTDELAEQPDHWDGAAGAPWVAERERASLHAGPLGSRPSSSLQASTCPANASLISITSMSVNVISGFCRDCRTAGTSPSPGRRGSTPTEAVAITRTPGRAVDGRAIATTAAPSLIPQEFPAVTVPWGLNAPGRRPSRLAVMPARGRSSWTSEPKGTSSSANSPASAFAQAIWWERAAYWSWRLRCTPRSSASRSEARSISGSPRAAGASGARS